MKVALNKKLLETWFYDYKYVKKLSEATYVRSYEWLRLGLAVGFLMILSFIWNSSKFGEKSGWTD